MEKSISDGKARWRCWKGSGGGGDGGGAGRGDGGGGGHYSEVLCGEKM